MDPSLILHECKYNLVGCPAVLLASTSEQHYQREAGEHLKLLMNALKLEQARNDKFGDAMTAAQSRCRQLESDNASLAARVHAALVRLKKLRLSTAQREQLKSIECLDLRSMKKSLPKPRPQAERDPKAEDRLVARLKDKLAELRAKNRAQKECVDRMRADVAKRRANLKQDVPKVASVSIMGIPVEIKSPNGEDPRATAQRLQQLIFPSIGAPLTPMPMTPGTLNFAGVAKNLFKGAFNAKDSFGRKNPVSKASPPAAPTPEIFEPEPSKPSVEASIPAPKDLSMPQTPPPTAPKATAPEQPVAEIPAKSTAVPPVDRTLQTMESTTAPTASLFQQTGKFDANRLMKMPSEASRKRKYESFSEYAVAEDIFNVPREEKRLLHAMIKFDENTLKFKKLADAYEKQNLLTPERRMKFQRAHQLNRKQLLKNIYSARYPFSRKGDPARKD